MAAQVRASERDDALPPHGTGEPVAATSSHYPGTDELVPNSQNPGKKFDESAVDSHYHESGEPAFAANDKRDIADPVADCKDYEPLDNDSQGNDEDQLLLGGGVTTRRGEGAVTYNWVDITEQFVADCGQLELGQLLHDDMFGLFEGMSAVEMMDPKMDAGMVCNQTKRKVLNLPQSIEAGRVRVVGLTQEELIGIMDDTWACVATWLEGHSLAQTVFTNLYLHDPCGAVQDPILKAFCVGVLKFVDLARDRINRASVYEEEDFQTMTYSFRLAQDVSDAQACAALRDAEDDLHRVVKATRPRPGGDADTALRHALAEGVHARLRFTRSFVLVLTNVAREKGQGVEDARKQLAQMREGVGVMGRTGDLGVKAAARDGDESCVAMMGFEPLVNQRLLPPTFPRYTRIKSRADTHTYLDALIARLLHVCTVAQLYNLHELLEFFVDFSQTSPCLLSRSLLQLLFLPVGRRMFGVHALHDVVRDTVRQFCAPPALLARSPLYNNAQVKDLMDAFLTQAARSLTYLFQVTGHNRARQRDKWAHQLEELVLLQDEAEKLDAYLHSLMQKADPSWMYMYVQADPSWTYRACLGSWTLYQTLRVMIRHALSGLELELYAVHEYHYVFWYLCEGLYNWLLSTLSRADSFVVEHDALFGGEAPVVKGRGGAGGGAAVGGKKGKGKKAKARPHQGELTITQALHSLCGAYYKAVIGLRMDGKLPYPTYDFDSEEVRYNHRFAAFQCVHTPPPMPYAQFLEMTDVTRYDPPIRAADLYGGAAKCFQQARTYLETLPPPLSDDLQIVLKVAKTNFVVMRVLVSGHKRESRAPPEFDFTLHKLFPVIKLAA